MKRTIGIIILGIITIGAVAWACDEPARLVKFVSVASDRCTRGDIYLMFERTTKEGRPRNTTIVVTRADGRELYEALRPYYEGKSR